MSDSTRALALSSGCLAALGWGLTGTFIKLLPQFSTFEVLFIRLVVALVATIPLLGMQHSLWVHLTILARKPIAILLSSLMVFYYLFAVRAFQLAPVSDVVLVVGLSPLLGLAVKAVLRKPLNLLEGVGAVIAFSGLVLFVLPKLQGQMTDVSTYVTGLCFAFLSAAITLSYASLFKYYATLQPLVNPILIALMTFVLGSGLVIPIVGLASPSPILSIFHPEVFAIALGLGVVSTVIPTFCYSYAAKYLSPILTTALNLMTPIFAAAIAAIFLNEHLSLGSIIGAGLILIGILMLSVVKHESR